MVSDLALSIVDPGLEPRSGQTKVYKIGICCFSAKHAALRRKSKDWLARNQNNVSADCCFTMKSISACWFSTMQTSSSSSSSHWKLTCSRHDIAEKLLNWRKQQWLTHLMFRSLKFSALSNKTITFDLITDRIFVILNSWNWTMKWEIIKLRYCCNNSKMQYQNGRKKQKSIPLVNKYVTAYFPGLVQALKKKWQS
jgi:hypothetical protein